MAIKTKQDAETLYQSYMARYRVGEVEVKEKAKELSIQHKLEHDVEKDFPVK